jgi:hypothetical protein
VNGTRCNMCFKTTRSLELQISPQMQHLGLYLVKYCAASTGSDSGIVEHNVANSCRQQPGHVGSLCQ